MDGIEGYIDYIPRQNNTGTYLEIVLVLPKWGGDTMVIGEVYSPTEQEWFQQQDLVRWIEAQPAWKAAYSGNSTWANPGENTKKL
jgi:hypothetical protein